MKAIVARGGNPVTELGRGVHKLCPAAHGISSQRSSVGDEVVSRLEECPFRDWLELPGVFAGHDKVRRWNSAFEFQK